MTRQPAWVTWAFLATAILLPIGWLIAVIVSWDHIVDSHARLDYLIGAVGVVTPFTAGALVYDLVHFGVYLVQEEVRR